MRWPWQKKKRRVATAQERGIFRYWDGTSERGADPIRLLRELQSFPGFDIEGDPTAAMHDPAALSRCLEAIRGVFGVTPWTELPEGEQLGLTEPETLALLDQFGGFIDSLKKNSRPTSTTPPVTGPVDFQPSTPPTNTSDSADCTSDSNGAKPANPTDCSGPSKTPSEPASCP